MCSGAGEGVRVWGTLHLSSKASERPAGKQAPKASREQRQAGRKRAATQIEPARLVEVKRQPGDVEVKPVIVAEPLDAQCPDAARTQELYLYQSRGLDLRSGSLAAGL